MKKVLNISGGQIVYSLPSGQTLRLNDREEMSVSVSDMEGYLTTIEGKGLIKVTDFPDSASVEESSSASEESSLPVVQESKSIKRNKKKE